MIEMANCGHPKTGNTLRIKSNMNPKLIGGLLTALFLVCAPSLASGQGDSLGSLTASGKVKVETSGTGETIGHVADLKIQNVTDQPMTISIAPMILESSSGKNQDYACPKGQTVALAPNQTKTVPINGVCLNRDKPPVGKGVGGDLVMNEANPSAPQNPNSHLPATDANKLLQICTAKYDAAEKLQKEGALKNLPYQNAQKQKDIVVQWSTWTDPVISQMTGSPPATKGDLEKVVYKQVEKQGPMTTAKKKKLEEGIDAIFAAVELTTAKAKELEKPEKETPPVAGTTVAETPSGGQPVSAPTPPGETVAGTPAATPQGPGTTTTRPTATPPCKEDPLALDAAKGLVDKAVKACRDVDRLMDEAAKAEDAADADDAANPAAKAAADKAAKAAADAKEAAAIAAAAAKAAADKLEKSTGKDKPLDREDARVKKRAAKTAADDAEAAARAAEAATSPRRKKADAAKKKAIEELGTQWDARGEAKDAIKKLKCPENIDELTTRLEEACGKQSR